MGEEILIKTIFTIVYRHQENKRVSYICNGCSYIIIWEVE